MRSRQYVAQGATGCSEKGKTIANLAMVFFFHSRSRKNIGTVVSGASPQANAVEAKA
jgi:hypothetical protein